MTRLNTKIADIELKNPVMVSSGTFGFGIEYLKFFDPSCLGAIVTKGVTPLPRRGNPPPRIYETPAGVLNSIGLENPGIEEFLSDYLPKMTDQLDTCIIVNMSANTPEDYADLARRLDKETDVTALELNISCPNVKQGGIAFGSHPEIARQLVSLVKQHTTKPIIVKLSPNVTDIKEMAEAVVTGGCDAISLINTVVGMGISVEEQKPVLHNVFGGLSGPCVKPIALRAVWQVYEAVNVPIIGMGGIMDTKDALEFLMAGATCISVGSGNFRNPTIGKQIITGLDQHLKQEKYNSIEDIVGIAHDNKDSLCKGGDNHAR